MRFPKNNSLLISERLWPRVQKAAPNACWPWVGCCDHRGYGWLRFKNELFRCHRLALELNVNCIIPKHIWVLHRCDNPSCCNPDHLFLGTHNDNMADMTAKGRGTHLVGEACSRARLSELQALEILQTPKKYGMGVALSKKYGVSTGAIYSILQRRSWSYLDQQKAA